MTRIDPSEKPAPFQGEAARLSPSLLLSSRLSPPFRLETLKSRALFKDAANGPRFSTPAFTLLRRPTGQAEEQPPAPLRFGFTVTKKIGGAVERNRIRRRLKAAVCAAASGFPNLGMDLVILARKEAMTIGFQALVDDIARAVTALAQRSASRRPGSARNMTSVATKTSET